MLWLFAANKDVYIMLLECIPCCIETTAIVVYLSTEGVAVLYGATRGVEDKHVP